MEIKGTLTASYKTRKNKNKVINYAKLSQSNHRSCMALPGAGKQILRTKALVWYLNISRKQTGINKHCTDNFTYRQMSWKI